MSRKRSNIPTLLAGRVRPPRRAPKGGGGGSAVLRVQRGEDVSAAAHRPRPDFEHGALARAARGAAEAATYAESAMGEITACLEALADLLRPGGRRARRRSPKELDTGQAAVDAAVNAIDRIIDATRHDGYELLKGAWATSLPDVEHGCTHTFRLGSLEPSRLGSSRVGFLSSAVTGGTRSLGRVGHAVAHAVVRAAVAEVMRCREELSAFSSEAVDPLLRALEVAAENVCASEKSSIDSDLAIEASRLTQIDALLAGSQQDQPVSKLKGHAVLRLRRG